MRLRKIKHCCGFISIMLMMTLSMAIAEEMDPEADDEDEETEIQQLNEIGASGRIYRTREEQREAGLQREITPWLTLSTLLEGEIQHEVLKSKELSRDIDVSEDSASLQFGFILDPSELFEAELILEYDTEIDKFISDEAFIAFEYDPWEISIGKQYTPFGTYFSHFVSGPMLEFAETQSRRVVSLKYGPSDEFDLTLAFYQGRANEWSDDDQWDWALSVETWPLQMLSLGLSYQSDLADADERLLEESDNRYTDRVSAVSGYLLWIGRMYEVSIEYVAATGEFQELEKHKNRPIAWNAEYVHIIPEYNIEVAFRYEGSRELDEKPKRQYGIAFTRYEGKHASLTIEYLRAAYESDFLNFELDDEANISESNRFGVKVTFEF